MKIIGIITRKSKSKEDHDINCIYSNIVKIIYECNAIPIGIVLNEKYKEVIDICDGIIFQGGDNFEKYDKNALLYCYDQDIPTLGICLGMQLMGSIFGGRLINIKNHKNIHHIINIKINSKLYDIFNTDKLIVNSRHRSVLESTNLEISSRSQDGFIESIEDSSKKFFIGVQWHPEDINHKEIFKKLIDYTY